MTTASQQDDPREREGKRIPGFLPLMPARAPQTQPPSLGEGCPGWDRAARGGLMLGIRPAGEPDQTQQADVARQRSRCGRKGRLDQVLCRASSIWELLGASRRWET
jgi:hypothetical protein